MTRELAEADAAISCAAQRLASVSPVLAAGAAGHSDPHLAAPLYIAARAFLDLYKAQLAAAAAIAPAVRS